MTEPRSERPDMADYGVPDDLDGVLPWSWAEERLLACRNYFVVTASAAARPHVMPVWGVWLPEPGTFAFSCSPSSRKVRNIEANPQVSVAVDDSVEVVVLEGRAAFVEPATVADELHAFASKYWDDPQAVTDGEAFLAQNKVVQVTPERAFGIIEREEDFGPRATRWVW